MRLWSLHPKYLDSRGLVALWREALLAQAVLKGRTRGYRHHPQLLRFTTDSIAAYLRAIHSESLARGYRFDVAKIGRARRSGRLAVTRGQLDYEWRHLMRKLKTRDPKRRVALAGVKKPLSHPLFRVVRGGVASWEKV